MIEAKKARTDMREAAKSSNKKKLVSYYHDKTGSLRKYRQSQAITN